MKRAIRATTDSAVSGREIKNALLARKIGAEGAVLLKNNGVLPLTASEVALYGVGARHTAFGGTGSGECRPRYRVTIEEGLKNAGVAVTTDAFLDGLDGEYESAYRAWRKSLNKGLKKCKKTAQMDYASAHPFLPPLGGEIIKRDSAETALYVLTRQAGEGADRKTEAGDYYIRSEEFEQLKALCGQYQNVVLILNTCGVIDLSFTKELSLSAILYISLAGMEAGNAAADVLLGKVSPSGKLTATWAERYEDYPSHDIYSYRNGNPREEDYPEDVYAGYRWFHANGLSARYPFGYGLSYTRFEATCEEIIVKKSAVACTVSVKNIGERAGREVVQIYLSAPDGKLKKERVSLAGFQKTGLLEPDGREEVKVAFDLRDFASYDEESASFLLEAGDYILYLGSHAQRLTPVGVLSLSKTVATEKCKNVCSVKRELAFFAPPEREREIPALPKIPLDGDSFDCVVHTYPKSALQEGGAAFEKLSLSDKIKLLVGTSYLGAVKNTVFGAAGYTTSRFVRRGIPNMPMTDGPQGLNVSPASLGPKQNFINLPALPESMRFGFLGWLSGLGTPKAGTRRRVYYQYATAFPIETLAAQTFDCDLLRDMGRGGDGGVRRFVLPRPRDEYSPQPALRAELRVLFGGPASDGEACRRRRFGRAGEGGALCDLKALCLQQFGDGAQSVVEQFKRAGASGNLLKGVQNRRARGKARGRYGKLQHGKRRIRLQQLRALNGRSQKRIRLRRACDDRLARRGARRKLRRKVRSRGVRPRYARLSCGGQENQARVQEGRNFKRGNRTLRAPRFQCGNQARDKLRKKHILQREVRHEKTKNH